MKRYVKRHGKHSLSNRRTKGKDKKYRNNKIAKIISDSILEELRRPSILRELFTEL